MTKDELIEENKMFKEVLQSWIDADMLDMVPSYEDNRCLRNEKCKAVINQEMYSATITNLRDENVRLKVELDNLEDQLYLWEDVPDEDLWEDGELKRDEVFDKINYHLFVEGDWKLMRKKNND